MSNFLESMERIEKCIVSRLLSNCALFSFHSRQFTEKLKKKRKMISHRRFVFFCCFCSFSIIRIFSADYVPLHSKTQNNALNTQNTGMYTRSTILYAAQLNLQKKQFRPKTLLHKNAIQGMSRKKKLDSRFSTAFLD